MKKVLFLGCGKQGRVFYDLFSCSYETYVLSKTHKNFTHHSYINPKDLPKIKFDVIFFAIKPQQLSEVLEYLTSELYDRSTLFISIVAGKRIEIFENKFSQNTAIIRLMPNLAVSTGYGVTSVFMNENAVKYKQEIDLILNKTGKVIVLQNEEQIDKFTVLTGCMPGYLYFLLDLMEDAIRENFGDCDRNLLIDTLIGSLLYAKQEGLAFDALYSAVASKGGVTEAGLDIFKQKSDDLTNLFKMCLENSYKKALNFK